MIGDRQFQTIQTLDTEMFQHHQNLILEYPKTEWLCTHIFSLIDMAFHMKHPLICYESHIFPRPDKPNLFYWVTEKHASALGQTIRSTDGFRLDLTCFKSEKAHRLFGLNIPPDVRIKSLIIVHRSGDEESKVSMHIWGLIAHQLKLKRLRIESAGFEIGALDALHNCLVEQENTSLEIIQMQTLRKPKASLTHSGLIKMTNSNKKR